MYIIYYPLFRVGGLDWTRTLVTVVCVAKKSFNSTNKQTKHLTTERSEAAAASRSDASRYVRRLRIRDCLLIRSFIIRHALFLLGYYYTLGLCLAVPIDLLFDTC